MRRTRLAITVITLLFGQTVAHSYELATHGALTWQAYQQSVLAKDFRLSRDLGIDLTKDVPFGSAYYDISGVQIQERSAQSFEQNIIEVGLKSLDAKHLSVPGWLMRGAIREDDAYKEDNPQDDPNPANATLRRPLHHFFDPVSNLPLTVTGIGALDSDIHTAPAWAMGTTNANAFPQPSVAEPGRRNHFTILDAREAMYRASTGRTKENEDAGPGNTLATEAARKAYWATTFRALGDILHLNQDMAQPQHTRNDQHAGKFPEALTGHASVFEKYIEARATGAPQFKIDGTKVTPTLLLYGGFPIPTFTKYSDFWSTSPGAGSFGGAGLADYSNSSFFSAGTNLGSNSYVRPSNSAASYAQESAAGLLPELPLQKINFLRGGPDNIRMTTEGLFDFFLVSTPPSYSLNRFNYDDQASLLIPRAVAYSAGLINYFFRGRLMAEDVEFTDTGVRLRVKNAIDVQQTPAWSNEVLYAINSSGQRGLFVLAYDYKDATGTKQYGASQPVPVKTAAEGGGDLAPGTTSTATYEFGVSIPSDARDVNYRLVFRGKLGQEEDAIAVGLVEPLSGFLVNPSYLPLDGVSGSRMIFRNAGAWKLSDRTSLIAGNIDWKGWYVNGRPTRVLSWWGPASRYFPYFDSGNPFTGVFRQEIYQNGELFAVTPHRVLGAALLKSSDGQEWLIAVCYDGANDIAYRRPAIKSDSSSLFDPIVAPDGWLEIGRLSDASLLLADRPWFFNSSGTAAQTLRTAQKTSEESNIFGTKLDRLKATVTRDNVSFERSGNLGPVVGTRTFVPRKSITIETAGDFRVTTYSGGRTFGFSEVGEYIVAVDFRKDEPVECRIVVNNTVSKNVDAIRSAVDCIRNCGGTSNSFDETFKQTDQTVTSEKLQCGAEEVTLVGDKQTIVANARRTSAGSGDYEGTREVVETDFNGSVLAADSRHSMLASVTNDTEGGVSDVFLVPNRFQSSGRPCSSLLETNQHGSALVRRRLDEILLSGRKIVASDRSDTIAGERQSVEAVLVYQAAQLADPQTDCFSQEHSGATETRRFPELFASPISGAWQIDGAEHLLVSQEIPGGAFNYLSDGSLSQIIPPGAPGSRYYPAFVIK